MIIQRFTNKSCDITSMISTPSMTSTPPMKWVWTKVSNLKLVGGIGAQITISERNRVVNLYKHIMNNLIVQNNSASRYNSNVAKRNYHYSNVVRGYHICCLLWRKYWNSI